MLNYIKADIYKTLNRKYMYILLGIMLVLGIAFNVILGDKTTAYEAISISIDMLIVPMFLVVMMVDIIIADQVKEHTYKNVISFGAPRTKLYLANLISAVVVTVVLEIIIVAVFCGSALLLHQGNNLTAGFINNYILRLLSATLLYIACISIGGFLAIVIKNNTAFAFAYAGIFIVIASAVKILIMFVSDKFNIIRNILITTQLDNISKQVVSGNQLIEAAIIGIIYTIVFAVIGMVVFKRQEIK